MIDLQDAETVRTVSILRLIAHAWFPMFHERLGRNAPKEGKRPIFQAIQDRRFSNAWSLVEWVSPLRSITPEPYRSLKTDSGST